MMTSTRAIFLPLSLNIYTKKYPSASDSVSYLNVRALVGNNAAGRPSNVACTDTTDLLDGHHVSTVDREALGHKTMQEETQI